VTAVITWAFFLIWAFTPVVWILGREGMMDISGEECVACALDVTVKLVYGICMMLFRRYDLFLADSRENCDASRAYSPSRRIYRHGDSCR
jgi:bacteriorhodopsin